MDKSWWCVTLSGFLQSHSSLSVKLHFLWHALQWPWPVRKRFSSDHCRLWRSKLGSWSVGSTTVAVRWLQVMELSEQLTQFQERLLDQTEEVQHANTQLEQARQERDKLNAAHKQQIQQLISERDHFQVSLWIYSHVLFCCSWSGESDLVKQRFLPTRRLLAWYLLSKDGWLAVTYRYCVKTAKPILKLFWPSSFWPLVPITNSLQWGC